MDPREFRRQQRELQREYEKEQLAELERQGLVIGPDGNIYEKEALEELEQEEPVHPRESQGRREMDGGDVRGVASSHGSSAKKQQNSQSGSGKKLHHDPRSLGVGPIGISENYSPGGEYEDGEEFEDPDNRPEFDEDEEGESNIAKLL
mmetsp:Transcript_32878/g.29752  ORF Transcript_32878/g.29752 Transcript_32878/m.29752 type:complete len:148 (+) Transcript_32878:195-638(+)